MSGKGSRARPRRVSGDQWSENWDKAFGKKEESENQHPCERFGFKCEAQVNGENCGKPARYDDRGCGLAGQPFLMAFCKDHRPRHPKKR